MRIMHTVYINLFVACAYYERQYVWTDSPLSRNVSRLRLVRINYITISLVTVSII